jgi:hypothetical protein
VLPVPRHQKQPSRGDEDNHIDDEYPKVQRRKRYNKRSNGCERDKCERNLGSEPRLTRWTL